MATHNELWNVCPRKEDYEEWRKHKESIQEDEPWPGDCSCGCRFFHELEGKVGADWGVCTHPSSPRAGLLTFEHMGCKFFDNREKVEGSD